MHSEPSYAIIHMSLKYRPFLTLFAAILPAALIVLLAWPNLSPTLLVGAVIAGAAMLFVMRLFLEIVQVIADTLLPR